MKTSGLLLLTFAFSTLTFVAPNANALDIYMTTSGPVIDGSSTAVGHVGKIDIISWGLGGQNGTTFVGSSFQVGTAKEMPLTIQKTYDSATAGLYKQMLNQDSIDLVTLEIIDIDENNNNAEYPALKIVMQNAFAETINVSNDGTSLTTETIRFVCELLNIETQENSLTLPIVTPYNFLIMQSE